MAPFFLSLLPLLIIAPAAAAQTNITPGSSITAGTGSGASWPSPSGRFAFGFYPKSQGYAIGVWLATTPNNTVVWTLNRDDPPFTDGSIRLTFDGHLAWSATGGRGKALVQNTEPVRSAAMLDTGNFVLYNSLGKVLWSTFSSPTDTLLPGQSLLPLNQLLSSVSVADRSTGKFRLSNQIDGNIVLYPAGTSNTSDDAYWDIGTFEIGFLLTLSLNSSGELYAASASNNYSKTIVPAPPSNNGSKGEIYYRATLDFDGNLRLYSHRFADNGSSRTVVEWEALQDRDRCFIKGICGLNSYCVIDDSNQQSCRCPPGFDFVDAGGVQLDCAKNTTGSDCITGDGGGTNMTAATMAEVPNSTWVDNSYSIMPSTASVDDCKAACAADCFCDAILYLGGVCSKQSLPLKYGRIGTNNTAFVKVGPAAIPNPGLETNKGKRNLNRVAVGVSSALAAVSLTVLAISCFLVCQHRRMLRYRRISWQQDLSLDEEVTVRSFSYKEIEAAANGFTEELGRGAFSVVFRASLHKRDVAVKRLENMNESGGREFQQEVRAIGRTHHRNLVKLLGFCNEIGHRLLVYEYMSNGSLANYLFKTDAPPTWPERMNIVLDVARGLHYLHAEMETHVIHCDIKPHNILIDHAGTAKIADFGLAKLLMPDQTRTFTGVRGTRGYLAPEWNKLNAPITTKTDVFSFGVVLLQIVSCRRTDVFEDSLVEWVYECFEAGELERVTGNEVVDDKEVERVVRVGLWCVQTEPVARPTMKNVILMLEGNMRVPLPPAPGSMAGSV